MEVAKMQSITDKITRRIKHKRRGWVFGPGDFMDICTRAAVDQVLSRLVKQDVIRRLDRGIYDYPQKHKLLGTLSPNTDGVARVLAAGDIIFPSGAMAANMLGLSTQVPAKPVYITNSASRTRTIGKQTIILKHAKVAIMRNVSDKVNLLLQALSYLGKSNIDDIVVNRCALVLSDKDLTSISATMGLIPGWMADVIHKIEHVRDGQMGRTA